MKEGMNYSPTVFTSISLEEHDLLAIVAPSRSRQTLGQTENTKHKSNNQYAVLPTSM